jgi:threonine dehydratase
MLELEDVRGAAATLAGVAHRTPVLRSSRLNEQVGATVLLKAENLQRVGAFKFRGAYVKLSRLSSDELEAGVLTASSGNHAQAVALAARLLGSRATVLMPADAPVTKVAGTRGYGAEVITYDRYGEDRETLLASLAAERGSTVVHPYDDWDVMAGQGTVTLELLEQVGGLEALVVPIGGGGLMAGCSTVMRALQPSARVIGVEPAAGDDTRRSLEAGERRRIDVPRTIADGQQAQTPGVLTFEVNRTRVDEVVTVSDAEIIAAMQLLFDTVKVVAEPSGASALAAVMAGRLGPVMPATRIGVVLSGGNVGHGRFAQLMGAR